MLRSRFVQVGLTAIAASALGYLINQLPAIPDFPNKDKWIIAAVVLITVLSVAIACWQARQEAGESSLPALEKLLDTRKKLLRRLQRDIQQRLDDSLHELTKLDLRMEDQQQQVGQPRLSFSR